MNENRINENYEESEDIFVLTNEDGEEAEFEFLDLVEYEGDEYAVLLPVEDEGDGEVVILKTVAVDEETSSYEYIEDEKILTAVFEIFKEKYKDEIDFIDC